MITNPHKWYLITSFNKELSTFVKKNNIKQGNCEKLLGIKIYCQLSFNTNIDEVFRITLHEPLKVTLTTACVFL